MVEYTEYDAEALRHHATRCKRIVDGWPIGQRLMYGEAVTLPDPGNHAGKTVTLNVKGAHLTFRSVRDIHCVDGLSRAVSWRWERVYG